MYLVRHAAVVVDRAVPSHRRQLSPEGRRAARLAGLDATPDDRLREVTRPWSDDYEADVRRYLTGAAVSGWEPREAVLARLHAALDGFDGFAVTHGLAIALHGDMTFDEWRAMPFPAVIER